MTVLLHHLHLSLSPASRPSYPRLPSPSSATLHTRTLFRPPQRRRRRHHRHLLFSQCIRQPRQPVILKATTSAATFLSTGEALPSTKLLPSVITNVLPTQDMLGVKLLWGGCSSTVTVTVVVVAMLLLLWFSTKPLRCRGMPLHSITLVASTLQQPSHHPHPHQHHCLSRKCLPLHPTPSSTPKRPSFRPQPRSYSALLPKTAMFQLR